MSSPGTEGDGGRSERPLRILHVLLEPAYGTASTVAEVAPVLKQQGVDVNVALLSDGSAEDTSVYERIKNAGVACQKITIGGTRRGMRPSILSRIRDAVRVATQLRGMEADILHCHGTLALMAGLLCRPRRPIVTTFHGMTSRRSLTQRVYRVAAGRADKVIVLTHQDARAIRRFTASAKLHMARNAIDVSRWEQDVAAAGTLRPQLGIRADAFVVGLVGRLSPVKRTQPFLLAVAQSGWLERADVHIVVAGTGIEEERLERLVAECPALTERTHLLGHRSDVDAVLRTVDIVAIPSDSETQPMVALEAMASGVPLVAFAVGSLPRMLADGAGILVPRGDDDHLIEALDRLRMSPGERAALIKVAHRRVKETHDIAAIARDLLDNVYRPLMDRHS